MSKKEKVKEEKQGLEKPPAIEFHFGKASSFRDIFVDGAFGGITPRGYIQMSVYNERQAIPQKLAYRIKEDGTLGDELVDEREAKQGYFREIEANLIMDVDTAQAVMFWLAGKIEQLRSEASKATNEEKGVN